MRRRTFPVVQQSGADEDTDGQDDACDSLVTTAPLQEDPLPETPTLAPVITEESPSEENKYANSLLKPYVPPSADEALSTTPTNEANKGTVTADASHAIVTTESPYTQKPGLLPNFGYVLTPRDSEGPAYLQSGSTEQDQTKLSVPGKVLGAVKFDEPLSEGSKFLWPYVVVLAMLAATLFAALHRVRRR